MHNLRLLALPLFLASAVDLTAQATIRSQDPQPATGTALTLMKPGRDPNQPIDSAYTRKILEYTTEKFFLSPLVDYLPASASVPTPMAVLGDIAGAKNNLPYSKEVYAYFRMLEKASPRVKVYSIGTTEEGREMIAVAVASESLINSIDSNRANLAKLADPRTINMNDQTAERIVMESTPVYYITGAIHAPESGAPSALMELAYRLAVDESPYVRRIRDNVITLITPIVEVDGRDRLVDIFRWHMAHPGQTYPNLLYWGKYVAHDNNRDAMGLTLNLTRNVLDTYVGWKAQVIHDLHESGYFLYDNTVGDGPYNAWLDPLLTNEWQLLGWNNVQEMTRLGMPGVYTHGDFDTWSPGYLMFLAATHNGISRLYETMGNGGTAETLDRELSPAQTSRTWFRQNPPLPRVKWSLRNNNNYEQTGLLVSLGYFADNKRLFLQNFYEKSKRSIIKPGIEGPAAYVLPSDDPRSGAQASLLRVLQKQHVEIYRATAPFTVQVPVARAKPRGTTNADTAMARSVDTLAQKPKFAPREFPAGSYIVRMDQPYSRIADALLDYQYWSPTDPQKQPYDDTGWTFPENFAVDAIRVSDRKVLEVPMQHVVGEVRAPGGLRGTGSIYAIANNADNALTTLRYKLRRADIQIAEDSFDASGQKFPRGSFLVRGVQAPEFDKVITDLGLIAIGVSSMPSVKTHPARAARVAILHTWINTQSEGWWRQAFDLNELPYDYISTQDVARQSNLRAKYDVILFPPTSGSPQQIINGLPTWGNPMPWKKTPLTPNLGGTDETDDIRGGLSFQGMQNLSDFVKAGGVLVTVQNTAELATTGGLVSGVSMNLPAQNHAVGTLLRTKLVDAASPIVYGIADSLAVYSDAGQNFSVSNLYNVRGGARPPDANARPTGRGGPDDADVAQGRPRLDPRNEAAVRKPVQPWQAAPVTTEQERNPVMIIPPAMRPRVIMRFADQRNLLVSGLLDGNDIAQRPVVVDAPLGKGHVILMGNNPVWRGYTLGTYALVFNAMLNFDALDAGRKPDLR